jgi:hypothetical protein
MNFELLAQEENDAKKSEIFDQKGREKAQSIVGQREYMLRQGDIMIEWLAENPGIDEECWISDGWSEAYYKAILSHDFYDNPSIAGRLDRLKLEHLKKYL